MLYFEIANKSLIKYIWTHPNIVVSCLLSSIYMHASSLYLDMVLNSIPCVSVVVLYPTQCKIHAKSLVLLQ